MCCAIGLVDSRRAMAFQEYSIPCGKGLTVTVHLRSALHGLPIPAPEKVLGNAAGCILTGTTVVVNGLYDDSHRCIGSTPPVGNPVNGAPAFEAQTGVHEIHTLQALYG